LAAEGSRSVLFLTRGERGMGHLTAHPCTHHVDEQAAEAM